MWRGCATSALVPEVQPGLGLGAVGAAMDAGLFQGLKPALDLVAEEALTPRGREIIEIQEKIFDREKLERIFGGELVESWGLN